MSMVDYFVHCCSQDSPPDRRVGMRPQYQEIHCQIFGNSQNRVSRLAKIYMDDWR
jgi:hypothetical protein